MSLNLETSYSSGYHRLHCLVTVVLSMMVVAMMSYYVVHKEAAIDNGSSQSSDTQTPEGIGRSKRGVPCRPKFPETKKEVMLMFGDLFKTPNEQRQYEKKFFRRDTFHVNPPKDPKGNPYQLPLSPNPRPDGPRPKRSLSTWTYHACCASKRIFGSPNSATSDHINQMVNLVQWPNDRQYFLEDICSPTYHSRWSSCVKTPGLHRALIHNPAYNGAYSPSVIPRYIVHTIRYGGCCKCQDGQWFGK